MTIDESNTQERILTAGKEEFLQKGFKDASLRNIAAKAGVTTGAIYGYYTDKHSLFTALVEPSATALMEQFLVAQQNSVEFQKASIDLTFQYSTNALKEMLGYIYEHFDAFRLLICCSSGTAYEDYIELLVRVEEEATLSFAEILRQKGYAVEPISADLVHILTRAFFSAIFETVAHNMEKVEAEQYISHIVAFFQRGWSGLFGMK